jgi:hypothetical protein
VEGLSQYGLREDNLPNRRFYKGFKMEELKMMLQGELPIKDYLAKLRDNEPLVDQLRTLVPAEAKTNRSHPLWNKLSFETFQQYDFDLFRVLTGICRLDGTLGDNLSAYSLIAAVSAVKDPGLKLTTRYEEAFDLLLDVSGERFGGPEVDALIDEIIQAVLLEYTKKTERRKKAKERLYAAFHTEDKRFPRWVHGPDWPMGVNSPMAYLSSQKLRTGEGIVHVFRDADTGETREVEELY